MSTDRVRAPPLPPQPRRTFLSPRDPSCVPPLAPRLPLHVRRASRRPRRSRALLSVAVALKGGAWRDAGLAKLAKELSKGGGARELWMAQPEEPSWQPPPHPRRTIMGRGSLGKRKSCIPPSRPGATIGISEKDVSEQSESTARTATAAVVPAVPVADEPKLKPSRSRVAIRRASSNLQRPPPIKMSTTSAVSSEASGSGDSFGIGDASLLRKTWAGGTELKPTPNGWPPARERARAPLKAAAAPLQRPTSTAVRNIIGGEGAHFTGRVEPPPNRAALARANVAPARMVQANMEMVDVDVRELVRWDPSSRSWKPRVSDESVRRRSDRNGPGSL